MKRILQTLFLPLILSVTHPANATVEFKLRQLSPDLHVLYGQGGNIAISVGEDGIYLVDDQFAKLSEEIRAQVSKLKPGVPEFVINTHYHGDHTGGNENFAKAGSHVIAHNNVYRRLKDKHGEGSKFLPVISFGQDMTLHFNGENAKIWHYENAHTDGDAVIFYERANVVHTGDIFFNLNSLPYVDVNSGGSLDGVIAAVADILEHIDDNTTVIPGHGPVTNKSGLLEYKALLERAKGIMLVAIDKHQSLDAVIAAEPLAELELSYSDWLPQQRVTKLFYHSLTSSPSSD
ncbi:MULTISPECIES: MBL fold metallo-hydrolase [Pseudoalteromonas]|uniref:beta-lactamase n=1 Tax=Pseudoalteromonas amylolytica TaxID=1859457 RepID=A0A1S1MQB7_9GAMM|nr:MULTISPECIES: MBL fold metallo-hydrolase [Pseudoalteromonas]OHU87502.1 hydrolase [Pseudoalteromonas sp. JW3]OHU90945.1 hydrolase [Pseudoalteromonas amylolytica]